LPDKFVWGQDYHAVNNCLTDKHSVKWILVIGRKPRQIKRGFLFQRERINPVLLTLGRNEPLRGFGERQPPQGMLDGDFPCRN